MEIKVNLYGETLFTIEEEEFSIEDIRKKLVNEFDEVIFSDKEHTILNVEFSANIGSIARINIGKNQKFSKNNFENKLTNEFPRSIQNASSANIKFTGIITPVRKISINKNDTIINLFEECSPKLVEYFRNHIPEVIDYNKGFVDVTISKLKSLSENSDLKEEITKALNAPVCPICKRQIDRGLMQDYRKGLLISKDIVACPDCRQYNDEFHRELRRTLDIRDKYKKVFEDDNIELSFTEDI